MFDLLLLHKETGFAPTVFVCVLDHANTRSHLMSSSQDSGRSMDHRPLSSTTT